VAEDSLLICEIVYSELSGRFRSAAEVNDFLASNNIALDTSDRQTLVHAGKAWVEYARERPRGLVCPDCGAETMVQCRQCQARLSIRQRTLPDFYIAAHALLQADRLMTRDQRHFRRYFPDLELV
jgi:predicted nucleic acid-binding protein